MKPLITFIIVCLFILINLISYDAYPTLQCQIGCSLPATRRAMLNQLDTDGNFTYTNISACPGIFLGAVGGDQATSLCAPQWHICNTLDVSLLLQVPFSIIRPNTASDDGYDECYAYNASQDFGYCRFCTGNIDEDDMAGFGSGCTWSKTENSCIGDTLKNGFCCSGYLTNDGCQGQAYFDANELNGVVCCADNGLDPCYYTECPRNCCGNGVCDFSHGVCTCDIGYVSDSCCTECATLDCGTCLTTSGCGWCSGSKVCTSLSDPSCVNPSTDASQESSLCPAGLNVGAIVGSAVGALALLAIVGGIFLFTRYSTGEYEGFWRNFNKFDEGLSENPLYKRKNIEMESPLYERK